MLHRQVLATMVAALVSSLLVVAPASVEAAETLRQRGRIVKVVDGDTDPTLDRRDRYGRLLRYVIKVSTSRDVNKAQVFRGWASVYVYDDNPFKRVGQYRRAQRQAKTNLRGIWGLC